MNIKGKNIPAIQIPSKIIKKGYSITFNIYSKLKSTYYLARLHKSKHKTNSKIKVAFIVQMPEIWEKEAPVFEKMLSDKRFNPYLIIVPQYDFQKMVLNGYSEEKTFFESKYPNVNKIYKSDNNRFENIKDFGFEYIFYQRPYNQYLPNELKSNQVVKYSRICYIPYGKETLENPVQYNDDFFRNVYITFLAGREEYKFFKRKYLYNRMKKFQIIIWAGYPVFEKCHKVKKQCAINHILWTPRWSYDTNAGGSHFIEYKEVLFKIKDKFPDVKVTLRPHPLMWDNFIKEGIMSESEIKIYKDRMVQEGILMDTEHFFEDSIKDKSILITDISSIIPEYLLSERPLIYCPTQIPLNSFYKNILKGAYTAKSTKDIINYVELLLNGKDYMLQDRRKIIKNNYEYLDNATSNIVNFINKDYRSRVRK